eukprot:GHUV01027132.1.p1 GENE.GHUV01027132.1~~GHUV01027132.1.p1  ORF type:complete len:112 (-),score=15.29 GHUV01027132.1:1292-1627(-)
MLHCCSCCRHNNQLSRSIAVHPVLPYVLTSADDKLIKCWDWSKNWTCCQVFKGHSDYVMQVGNRTPVTGDTSKSVGVQWAAAQCTDTQPHVKSSHSQQSCDSLCRTLDASG